MRGIVTIEQVENDPGSYWIRAQVQDWHGIVKTLDGTVCIHKCDSSVKRNYQLVFAQLPDEGGYCPSLPKALDTAVSFMQAKADAEAAYQEEQNRLRDERESSQHEQNTLARP